MVRYHNFDIVFAEIPGETTLAFNITNCPNRCPGCHSPHLTADEGRVLDDAELLALLACYGRSVTCVSFMGGDAEPQEIARLAGVVRKNYPALYRIDAATFRIEQKFPFKLGDSPSEVQINGTGDKIFWINDDIWSMNVDDERVPVRPFLKYRGTKYYGLTVNPRNGDVYVADAIDYQQPGIIYRYTADGEPVDEFYAGIAPGAFCWK